MFRLNFYGTRTYKEAIEYFNTSYVSVKLKSSLGLWNKPRNFNTSYVSVKQLQEKWNQKLWFDFNTSYVSVKLKTLNEIHEVEEYFNTSYVSVKRSSILLTLLDSPISIHPMFRLNNFTRTLTTDSDVHFNTSYVSVKHKG